MTDITILEGDEPMTEVEESEEKHLSDSDLRELLSKLTELEKRFCQVLVYQRPSSKSHALKMAGSKANSKNLPKLAYEMSQREHVQLYMHHLQQVVQDEVGIDLQEIVNNARKAIEMSFANNKPRDAEPHNRLLAELGGFVKNSNATAPQTAIKIENNLKGEDVDRDIDKLQMILGSINQ